MAKKLVRSTVFCPADRTSQKEQEERVGEIFAQGYKQATGQRLEGNVPGPNPPDRLFFYQGLKIGVEMFELEQFYGARALFDSLTNEIYSEFEQHRACERYDGVVINLGVLANVEIAGRLKTRRREKKIKGNPKLTFAKELVDILLTNVPSQDSIPQGDRGLVIPVDSARYPAVSALIISIHIARCPSNDPRRTDGKAAPLVIISPGFTFRDSEIEVAIEEMIVSKMHKRLNWEPVDHSVLVAHDLPRGEVYQGFAMKWNEWLVRVASRVELLQAFDEFWLVTVQDLRGKAQRICGKEIG